MDKKMENKKSKFQTSWKKRGILFLKSAVSKFLSIDGVALMLMADKHKIHDRD